jgi:hypothetical protein
VKYFRMNIQTSHRRLPFLSVLTLIFSVLSLLIPVLVISVVCFIGIDRVTNWMDYRYSLVNGVNFSIPLIGLIVGIVGLITIARSKNSTYAYYLTFTAATFSFFYLIISFFMSPSNIQHRDMDARCTANLNSIFTVVLLYYSEHGQILAGGNSKLGTFVCPADPIHSPYIYRTFTLPIQLGADINKYSHLIFAYDKEAWHRNSVMLQTELDISMF